MELSWPDFIDKMFATANKIIVACDPHYKAHTRTTKSPDGDVGSGTREEHQRIMNMARLLNCVLFVQVPCVDCMPLDVCQRQMLACLISNTQWHSAYMEARPQSARRHARRAWQVYTKGNRGGWLVPVLFKPKGKRDDVPEGIQRRVWCSCYVRPPCGMWTCVHKSVFCSR